VVKLRGGLQWMKDKQIYRSRRVLTEEEAALMGKGTLTKETGTDNWEVAQHMCEGHLQEFERLIQAARAADADPLEKFTSQIRRPPALPDGRDRRFLLRRRVGASVPPQTPKPHPSRSPLTRCSTPGS
jgi:hypothetical protein